MSFHGGLLGMILAAWYICRKKGWEFFEIADLVSAAAPIGLGLGRIGNFINGELYGRPTNVSWAMVFPEGGTAARHPSQLYEALLEGLVLVRDSPMDLQEEFLPGTVFWALLGVLRTVPVSGGIRAQSRIRRSGFDLGPFTRGQELTFPMLLLGGVMMAIYIRRRRTGSGASQT